MAVSISYQPPTYNPAYNDIVFIVDSTLKSNCNMKYVFDVFVEGDNVGRFDAYPNQDDGSCAYNFSGILRDYVGNDIDTGWLTANNVKGVRRAVSAIKSFKVQFGESTDGTTGCTGSSFVVTMGATSSEKYVWNAALNYAEGATFGEYSFVNVTGSTCGWLTEAPVQTVHPGETALLAVLQRSETGATYSHVRYTTTSLTGATAEYFYDMSANTNFTSNTAQNRMLYVGAGPLNLLPNEQPQSYFRDFPTNATGSTVTNLFVNYTTDFYEIDMVRVGLGAEKVFDGSFSGATAWTGSGFIGYSIGPDSGSMLFQVSGTGGGGGGYVASISNNGATLDAGVGYQVSFTCTVNTFPNNTVANVFLGNTSFMQITNPVAGVTYTGYVIASSRFFGDPISLSFQGGYAGATGDIRIDNLSIAQVTVTPRTPKKRFNYVQTTTRFPTKRLMWMNRFGGMDSASFRLLATEDLAVKRTEYSRTLGSQRLNNVGATSWGYSYGDRSRQVTSVDTSKKFTASSEFVTEENMDWLEGLYSSPVATEVSLPPMQCAFQAGASSGANSLIAQVQLTENPFTTSDVIVFDMINAPSAAYCRMVDINSIATLSDRIFYYEIGNMYGLSDFYGRANIYNSLFIPKYTPLVITSKMWSRKDALLYGGRNRQWTIEYENAWIETRQTGS